MHRELSIIFFLFLSLTGFSQSKKQQFHSLLAECNRAAAINDSLDKVCLEQTKKFKEVNDRYTLLCSGILISKTKAENSWKEFERMTEDYNRMIRHFNLEDYEPFVVMQEELVPEIPEKYRPTLQETFLPVMSVPIMLVEKRKYREKISILTSYRTNLLGWQEKAIAYNTKALTEIRILGEKIQELYDLDSKYRTISRRNNDAKESVLNEIFEMVEVLKKKKRDSDVPLRFEEYFYYSDRREEFGTKVNAPDFDDQEAPSPTDQQQYPKNDSDEVYVFTDVQAEFPGGFTALKAYFAENLIYPEVAVKMKLKGVAYLKFVVSKSGSISNVSLVRGVPDCLECDKEAFRLVKSMPNWVPGKLNGKEVNSWFTLPVKFELPK